MSVEAEFVVSEAGDAPTHTQQIKGAAKIFKRDRII